ncbi:hypothetical protein LJB92_04325 [Bacteroidales bacterium OttesenSCG-928-M06]|nr:hypothetical protein [Bacteroidales bacterium OttesenSCG-928-M06]
MILTSCFFLSGWIIETASASGNDIYSSYYKSEEKNISETGNLFKVQEKKEVLNSGNIEFSGSSLGNSIEGDPGNNFVGNAGDNSSENGLNGNPDIMLSEIEDDGAIADAIPFLLILTFLYAVRKNKMGQKFE